MSGKYWVILPHFIYIFSSSQGQNMQTAYAEVDESDAAGEHRRRETYKLQDLRKVQSGLGTKAPDGQGWPTQVREATGQGGGVQGHAEQDQ